MENYKNKTTSSPRGSVVREKNAGSKEGAIKRSLIAPPGLIRDIIEFESCFNVAKGKPILIVGETGVGKSLFLLIFEKLWQEQTGRDEKMIPINCSHFDPALARSELFGHTKGSFTGAVSEKVGWIKKADTNKFPLILDEVGKLSPDVQAQLLTVIEDGKFFKVGSIKFEEANNIQIIGATNDEKTLASDFKLRFLRFHVSPICTRRIDILYYLYDQFPDLVKTLRRWEVLVLLSYNWPGNVREIESTARWIQAIHDSTNYRPQFFPDEESSAESQNYLDKHRFFHPEVGLGGFYSPIQTLYIGLKEKGIDINNVEAILNKYRVGIDYRSTELAFPEISNDSELKLQPKYMQRFDINCYGRFKPFEEAVIGHEIFCTMFFQGPDAHGNSLELKRENAEFFQSGYARLEGVKSLRCMLSIFEYLSGINLDLGMMKNLDGVNLRREPSGDWELTVEDTYKLFRSLASRFPSNEFLAAIFKRKPEEAKGNSDPDIFSMTDQDHQKYFYKGVIDRCGGNQKQAAARLGLNYNTFRGRLKKLELI